MSLTAEPWVETPASKPARGFWEALALRDRAAVGMAYDAHHQSVRAFARRLVGDEATSEDLVQKTFISLPQAALRHDGEGTLRSLLLGICANHARHAKRSRARENDALQRYLQERPAGASADGEERIGLRQRLRAALDELSHEHRVVIVLVDVEERSALEVSSILGIPEATVRTRLFHAKRRLRAFFEERT